MKVKHAIEILSKYNAPDDEILIAWWDKEFTAEHNLTDEEWSRLVQVMDKRSDNLLEDVHWGIEQTIQEIRNGEI